MKERPYWVNAMREFSVLSSELVASVGVCTGLVYLGYRYLGFPIWTLALGAISGLTLAMYRLYLRYQKD